MPGSQTLEHAHVRVPDIDEAIGFYEDVLGLTERRRSDGVAYLGLEPTTHYDLIDDHYDLALEEGGTGLEHFAIRVSEDTLASNVDALETEGVEYDRLSGEEPGQVDGVRLDLPSGHAMELVVVEKNEQPDRHTLTPPEHQHAPNSLDHITIITSDVRGTAEFLRDVLDFHISDVARFAPDQWGMAFVRHRDHHHDIAIMGDPSADEPQLHHVAWTVTDMAHMRTMMDVLGRHVGEVELGPTRHVLGDNISLYVFDPSQNRMEFTTEVVSLDPDSPTTFHDDDVNEIVTHWPGTYPIMEEGVEEGHE